MYICIHMCMYVCIYIYIYTYIRIRIRTHAYTTNDVIYQTSPYLSCRART